MTYVIGEKYCNSVIETAAYVARCARGSEQPLGDVPDRAAAWLRWRVETEVWKAPSSDFDAAVRVLACEAIWVWENRLPV